MATGTRFPKVDEIALARLLQAQGRGKVLEAAGWEGWHLVSQVQSRSSWPTRRKLEIAALHAPTIGLVVEKQSQFERGSAVGVLMHHDAPAARGHGPPCMHVALRRL